MSDRRTAAGFTMVEMLMVMVVIMPLLIAVAGGTTMVNATVDTQVRQSEVSSHVRRNARRMVQFLRPGKLSSVQVPATAADVNAGLATAVGEWMSPTDNVWRTGIELQAASGLLSMNAALSTQPRRLLFVMDDNELDNGIDDDGDALIDEGQVVFEENNVDITVVRNVELCEFALSGRMVMLRIIIGRRDSKGRVFRGYSEHSIYMRNN